MTSWAILKHSAKLVWRNRMDALKVSLVLYGVAVVVQVLLGTTGSGPMTMPMDPDMAGDPAMMPMTPAGALSAFVAFLVQIVATLWIAVSWHRYVLLEEYPAGWLPPFHGGRMLAYLGRSILIGILVMLVAAVAAVPFALLAAIIPLLAALAPLAAVIASITASFRLAPMLPGTATDRPLGIKEALEATRGALGTALGLAILSVIALIVLQFPVLALLFVLPPLGILAMVVLGWFVTMVSVSVLTTIYGHYVEGRPLG